METIGQWIMVKGADDSKAIGRQTTRQEEGGDLSAADNGMMSTGGAITHTGGRAGGHTTIKK